MNNNTEYRYVDGADSLKLLTEVLGGVSRVGLDTEADSLHHYFEKVCLIQLSFSGQSYILDPLAGFSLDGFLEVLSKKELIIQGADYDLRMLKKTFDFRPQAPVFDTMLAAQVLGYEKIGLAALAEKFFGVLLSKSGQKSDWAKRPLSAKQLCYASDDTKYLEGIADRLTEELKALGRLAWHRECCERVVKSSCLQPQADSKEAWRIKGSSGLDPKELSFVREIWKWRDEEARKRDRPPFMILKNEDLIDLARRKSQGLPELPSYLKRISGEVFARLEQAIRIAEGLSPKEWPVPPERTRTREVAVSQEKVETLRAACKTIAENLHIEPCFLASRAVLTEVARHQPRTVEEIMKTSGMMRWQAELVMPAVQAAQNPARGKASMIFDAFENCANYPGIPYSKEILQFASSRDCSGILEPEIEILGRDLFVRIAEYLPGPAEEKNFEAHRIYADLQWVVKGEEIIQHSGEPAPLPVTDYDAADDIQFFKTPQRFSSQTVSGGQCVFFLPGELHRPGCQTGSGNGKVKKLVFKIRIPS